LDAFLFEFDELGFGDGGGAGECVDFLLISLLELYQSGAIIEKAYESAGFKETVRNRSAGLSGCSNDQHLDRSHVVEVSGSDSNTTTFERIMQVGVENHSGL
jgi:hypothetical protein